jgi:hypothetical protein
MSLNLKIFTTHVIDAKFVIMIHYTILRIFEKFRKDWNPDFVSFNS